MRIDERAPTAEGDVASQAASLTKRRPLWRRILRLLFNTFRNVCTLAVLIYVGISLRYDRTRMVSGSMAPALDGERDRGDWVLVDRWAYRKRSPRRGDLIYFRDFEDRLIIKRVVGLPGETIQIKDDKAHIDGQPVADPPIFQDLTYDNCGMFRKPERKFLVRDGWYFVMGDFTRDSYDSRFFGPIKADQVLGRAAFVYWPVPRIGPVH